MHFLYYIAGSFESIFSPHAAILIPFSTVLRLPSDGSNTLYGIRVLWHLLTYFRRLVFAHGCKLSPKEPAGGTERRLATRQAYFKIWQQGSEKRYAIL